MTDLVITNYDNFKDLSYFIGEHQKALNILDEVQKFYLSFLKSKLISNHDLDRYPGKLIIQKFHSKEDYIHVYDDHNPQYNDYVKDAHLQDKHCYWFTIKTIKEDKEKWRTYKLKRCDILYDIERPYYVCAIDITSAPYYSSYVCDLNELKDHGYYKCGKKYIRPTNVEEYIKKLEDKINRIKEQEKEHKLLSSLINADCYKSQDTFKKELSKYFQKYCDKCYYAINPVNQRLIQFGGEDDLNKFSFKISDDKRYLIVYTAKSTGGTRTDRWKTFEYKGVDYNEFWFDVTTGNFVENRKYFDKNWEVEMDVHNGWHPYDDD